MPGFVIVKPRFTDILLHDCDSALAAECRATAGNRAEAVGVIIWSQPHRHAGALCHRMAVLLLVLSTSKRAISLSCLVLPHCFASATLVQDATKNLVKADGQ
jgi:hypothetical protein